MEDSPPSGITLRPGSGLPVYLQLIDQLRYLIQAGRYRVGDYLPTTRRLAGELGVNFNTVNRAYRQLQRDGLIASTPGKGAVVLQPGRADETGGAPSSRHAASTPAGVAEVDAILSAALERTLAAGLRVPEITERVRTLLAELARRVPPPRRIELDAGRAWRSERLATQLSAVSGFAVTPCQIGGYGSGGAATGLAPESARITVRPQYGAWIPAGDAGEGDVTIRGPVLLARGSVQAILGLEPGARICAIAADEGIARWLLDATTALASEYAGSRWEAVPDASAFLPGSSEWVVAEAGLPGLPVLTERAKERVLVVDMSFPVSVTREIRDAVSAAR